MIEKRSFMKPNASRLIQSVERAVDILNCFELHHTRLTLAEISRQTGLNINTVRGLVNTLVAKGLIAHDENSNTYQLGYYFMGRAKIIQSEIDTYIHLCKSAIDELANTYSITASIQMVQHDNIETVYCAYPHHAAYYIILSDYSDLPKHAMASGLLLLAYSYPSDEELNALPFPAFTPYTLQNADDLKKRLAQIRIDGYSQETEEFALDVGSLAVPIFDPFQGQLIMTVSCTFFVKNLDRIKADVLRDLQTIAHNVMTRLRAGV